MVYKGTSKLGDFFTSRRERGAPGLPLLSVTMNHGVVIRKSLDRKMKTELSDEEHLLVYKDDIVYNMMRMWQGASGLSDRDGLLSPAYVVLAPKKGIDPLYASYLFKSSRLIYLFWAYSYGLTSDRLRLYFNDFKSIPVNIPPLPEQRKIGIILLTWDKAIAITEQLLTNSQQQKKALIYHLLTGKVRLSEFDGDWKEFKLMQVCEFKKGNGLSKELISDNGKYKCVLYGELYTKYREVIKNVVSHTDTEVVTKSVEGDILIPSSTTTSGIDLANAVALLEDNVLLGGDINILRPNRNLVCSIFLAHFLTHIKKHDIAAFAQGITIVHLYGSDLKPLKVKLPNLIEQQKISAVLTSADHEIEILQQKLDYLKQEKKALMQQLLTGKRRVKVDES